MKTIHEMGSIDKFFSVFFDILEFYGKYRKKHSKVTDEQCDYETISLDKFMKEPLATLLIGYLISIFACLFEYFRKRNKGTR